MPGAVCSLAPAEAKNHLQRKKPCMDYNKVMEKQATINIGIIGHVAHGKSTLVNAISGVRTVRFKSELEKNITIKLGYANTKIYMCDSEECPRPGRYRSFKSSAKDGKKCPRQGCSGRLRLARHVSFVDCPGHDVLMSTMINGTAIMDSAILLVAANEPCPQPQTQEHLFALERTDISHIVVVQNKIDLISRERCLNQRDGIREFLSTTKACNSPIVPVSGQYKINIDAVLDFIVNYIPQTARDTEAPPRMVIIRSFDVNKPGFKVDMLCGGVIGGSLLRGRVRIGDEIEVRPGHVTREGRRFVCMPYLSRIVSLKTEDNELNEAYPGGLIGIGTEIDPACCIADALVGQVMGIRGCLPSIYVSIDVRFELFPEVAGQRVPGKHSTAMAPGEAFLLNIGSCSLAASLLSIDNSIAKFELSRPVCSDIEEKITISKKVAGSWRLIGYATVVGGESLEPLYEDEGALEMASLRASLAES